MNHWAFVTAAYLLTGVVSGGLALASWLAMRAAERPPSSSRVER